MTEFEFIAAHLRPLAGPAALNLEDDAAVWMPPPGKDIVVSTDTLVEGVHFPKGRYSGEVAERALRVNLSDLAAMGATPFGYLLNLTLPQTVSETHLKGFVVGLRECQQSYDIDLLGGDTTRADGPFTVSITAIGYVPAGQAVKRSGARPGDRLLMTGPIGDAALGLKIMQSDTPFVPADGKAIHCWEEAYWRPQPRLDVRKILRNYATAAIDISDGLIADAGHIAKASNSKIDITLSKIPLSSSSQKWVDAQTNSENAHLNLATAGDDYQLAFTVAQDNLGAAFQAALRVGVSLTDIGAVKKGTGVEVLGYSGEVLVVKNAGYSHF